MNEQWTRWEPIPNLSKSYCIESIHDSLQGFKIVLSNENAKNKSIEIMFEDSVYAYASTDDTSVGTIINQLYLEYGTAFYRDWTLFKVSNSNYIQRLSEQSYDIISSRPLIHFSFITIDSILDVISDYEPKITFITADSKFENNDTTDECNKTEDTSSVTPESLEKMDKGKFGILPDGREVSLRSNSIAKVPTLETYDPITKKSTKIRYMK